MGIPVVRCLRDRLGDLVPGFEATPGQGEGAQHLPPWLDEVEVGGVFGLEHHLPAQVRQHEQQPVGGTMAAQVVGDGIDPLDLWRQPGFDRVEESYPVPGATARIGMREGGARRGTEGAEDIALAAPAVIDLLSRAACRRRTRPDRFAAQVTLGAERTDLVEADDYATLGWGRVERLNPPLFSANSGSTRSPNQVSCRRQRSPSLSRISSIRLRRMAIPFCSSR